MLKRKNCRTSNDVSGDGTPEVADYCSCIPSDLTLIGGRKRPSLGLGQGKKAWAWSR